MPIFAKLEICRDATPRSAAVNMAIDEALLEILLMSLVMRLSVI